MDGYVYAGYPPLYRIVEGKDKYIYLKNDDELDKYRKEHLSQKYQVTRMKGLGEMDQDETDILVNPEKRNIKQITVENINATNILFDQLMGTAVQPRKEFIKIHSKEAVNGI